MLDLLRAYSGSPSRPPLLLPRQSATLVIYPVADAVVLLQVPSLLLVRTLVFWEAFPGLAGAKGKVKCIATDRSSQMVLAAMDDKIAAWTPSPTNEDAWKVHSTLFMPQAVTCMDCASGLLVACTQSDMSIFRLNDKSDLPEWALEWSSQVPLVNSLALSPALSYIASTSSSERFVRIHSISVRREVQRIRHPRPVISIRWRASSSKNPEDVVLFTITSDYTLRIFFPVVDSPHALQLHASLDRFSFLPPSPQNPEALQTGSTIFPLDREVMSTFLACASEGSPPTNETDEGRQNRINEIQKEGWDLFARVLSDGSVVIRAIANIDRRPPTLLKPFTILQSPPKLLPSPPTLLLPALSTSIPSIVTWPPISAYRLSPLLFFDAQADGLSLLAQGQRSFPRSDIDILKFVRNPSGSAVGVLRAGGGGEVYALRKNNKLVFIGRWEDTAGEAAVFDKGKSLVIYSQQSHTLVAYHFPNEPMPEYSPTPISATLQFPTALTPPISFFTLSPKEDYTELIVISPAALHLVRFTRKPAPELVLLATSVLEPKSKMPGPEPARIALVLPVDPMAWASSPKTLSLRRRQHDVLVSISEEGELAFWEFSVGLGSIKNSEGERYSAGGGGNEGKGTGVDVTWRCTGKIRTGRRNIAMARCSSAKKTVLVVKKDKGEELTIWDSKESEFSSGLEFTSIYKERVNDLDWTSTDDSQSILAVGFAHRVVLLCQQRMNYFDSEPTWEVLGQIDIAPTTPYSIGDSIWLAGGSLLVGAGHQIFHYGRNPASLSQNGASEDLFETVARENGPLEDYHPQMILQCLLWGKIELVKEIIVRLERGLDEATRNDAENNTSLCLKVAIQCRKSPSPTVHAYKLRLRLSRSENERVFSKALVNRLIERLEEKPLPHLTTNELSHLIVLIQTTLEVHEQRRALDANGLRYLISMRSFYIMNSRITAPSGSSSLSSNLNNTTTLARRERIRYRDIVWAFHSESQEILLTASTTACGGRMMWNDAKSLGVFLWMNSTEAIKAQMEVVARNQYMGGDARDPTSCCLFYFALGKVKLVHGLWKQAAWHKEQAITLKFLSNDFGEARWKTAALKNAFALLSKRRFEYAAAFFLLGGSLKDAVNVCIKQMGDFQLAIALARVGENGDDGPILRDILLKTVIPLAFREGNRWLASWAFWILRRRDLAVQILLTPLSTFVSTLDIPDVPIDGIGDPHYDDPSLALLFSQLKSKSLQTAKGTSQISGQTEFNFVLQISRVFCRMGCHALALDLVKHWSFDRPALSSERFAPPPSPTIEKRTEIISAAARPRPSRPSHLNRRRSLIIDMDIPSLPPSLANTPPLASPALEIAPSREPLAVSTPTVDADSVARKTGLGDLMKSAKRDVQVPEFDMDAFF
ncbi:hypothetical protein BOTBODRAFT_159267, partial [Botryobasidium botryosum FD-172 SS1]